MILFIIKDVELRRRLIFYRIIKRLGDEKLIKIIEISVEFGITESGKRSLALWSIDLTQAEYDLQGLTPRGEPQRRKGRQVRKSRKLLLFAGLARKTLLKSFCLTFYRKESNWP